MKNNIKPKKKGFTLTEMLVVVMVISVLAAIAYPLYTKAATKSRAIEAINLLEMVRNKQLKKYAESRAYYSSFDSMGQLTANQKNEVISGQVLKVKDYTLSLNNVHSCMTATYEKGRTKFSFSSSYEYTGLGCTGDVCSSFGDIVGTAKDVCNCGSKSCTNGYTLNEDTCNCDCYLGCDQGGTCFAPYGGGQTRACASGCGTQNSTASCSGPVWTGSCWSPTQTQATSQTCATGCGTQTRTCSASCSGGSCGSWNTSACYAKTQTLPTSQACGNSGTQTRTCTATCSGGSCASWGACTGEKTACPSTCPSGQKRNTAVANEEDGACCVAKTSCSSSCPSGQQRTSVSYTEDGACCSAKTACPSTCPSGQKRNTSVTYSEDGSCCVAKTACPSSCPSGQQRTSVSYSEDGDCCSAKTSCPSTCPSGQKRDTSVNYSEEGDCCVAKTACASTCQSGYHRDTAVSYSDDGECCVKDDCDTAEQAACTNTAGTWTSSNCSCSCPAGKSWGSTSGCGCPNLADQSICGSSGGTFNSNTCTCSCPSPKTFDASNGCVCSNASESSSCVSGGGSWNPSTCACVCGSGKTWSGSACVCADTTAQTNCANSKGTWNASSCTCACPQNYVLTSGKCTAKFKAQSTNIGVLVNCHYCPDGFGWRTACNGSNDEDCYYSGSFDTSQGCSSATSTREASQYVISYEFYVGGYLEKRAGGTNGGGDPEDAYLWWTGGTRIGGKMYRYSGGSMPNCPSDPQTFCDQRCKATNSSCNDKCLVSMSTSGCTNPRYKYCWYKCSPTRYSASNSSGSGVVVMCK